MSAPSIDPCEFVLNYKASELQVAAEFFTHWLPFLSHDLCGKCTQILQNRVRSLDSGVLQPTSNADDSENVESENLVRLSYTRQDSGSSCDELEANSPSCQTDCGHEYSEQAVDQRALQPFPDVETPGDWVDVADSDNGCHECTENSPDHWGDGAEKGQEHSVDYATSEKAQPLSDASTSHMSWADMAQEDELEEANRQSWADACDMATENLRVQQKTELSRDRREYIRFMNVRRKKDFILLERVKGKIVNILDGLELHAGVFSAVEQKRIVDYIYSLQEMGKKGQLKARTYSEPAKWMRGKGRVTIQFGCCYNYAVDKNGNPPGILREELVDPIPHLFKVIIRRLVRWHVLPPTCVPDSCIVNIYEPGDCIPPHIDNHDFVRPFCSVSFLSECNILFGSNLRIVGPGEFSGSTAIPLPVGSVLVLKGNGADVAKHCIPGVPAKRISITFRKMDNTKLPFRFVPEPDLQCIQPLPYDSSNPTNKPASKAHQTYFNRHQVLEGGSEESELHGGQASRFVQPRFPRGRSRSSNRPRVRLNLPKN